MLTSSLISDSSRHLSMICGSITRRIAGSSMGIQSITTSGVQSTGAKQANPRGAMKSSSGGTLSQESLSVLANALRARPMSALPVRKVMPVVVQSPAPKNIENTDSESDAALLVLEAESRSTSLPNDDGQNLHAFGAAPAADGMALNVMPPTPTLPSGKAMAGYLMTYCRMLQHESTSGSGAAIAAAGLVVVERVRVGLLALLGHPVHGVKGGHNWQEKEAAAIHKLEELERDIVNMQSCPTIHSQMQIVQVASMHCADVAQAVQNL